MTARALSVLISMVALAAIVFGMVLVAGKAEPPPVDDPHAFLPTWPKPTDHHGFFEGPFEDGPSVTRACLVCHPDAATEVMQTSHWTWAGAHAVDPTTGDTIAIGKKNLQNNFCIAIPGNWPRCTSCHVGYGWKDDTFFETATEAHVDCLVCHDTTGDYQKTPTGAGLPAEDVDLLAVAESVGRTSRGTCGGCHFKGGGGDGVKHGDLDETLYFPPESVDVHMGRHGLVCADCHRAEHHRIRGRLLPEREDAGTRVACTDCHAEAPHAQDRLNAHVRTLACQTCHIPTFAVQTATKMWWDWSKAGLDGDPHEVAETLVVRMRDDPEERATYPPEIVRLADRVEDDPSVYAHYDPKKGLFLIAGNQMPEYRWYNGFTKRYLPGEAVGDEDVVPINRPLGAARDPTAKIWPFKVHRGRQPVDLENEYLLYPHVFGKGGYWKTYDWDSALTQGGEAAGVPFSGAYGWKITEMYWPQNHMVQVKEKALDCVDCHGTGGRMDWKALGYPGDPAFQGDRRQMDVVRDDAAPEGER